MQNDKVLQIFNNEKKFSKAYFEFLQQNDFNLENHTLFHYGKDDGTFNVFKMTCMFSNLFDIPKHLRLLGLLHSHRKIIIHSLASPWLLLYLYLFPSLYPKTYWIVWGKDLHFYKLLEKKYFYHEIYEFFRKRVFKNIQHISALPGDYDLAHEWYGVNAKCYVSFMYPSNLFKEYKLPPKSNSILTIQVGNSSDPSNNHEDSFAKLEKFKDENIEIVVPLAYGNKSHRKKILKLGQAIFAEKFKPLTEFIPFDEYMGLLANVDIAIFNHNRTQANGNVITLLGFGKKVYLRSNISSWPVFEQQNIRVFDTLEGINIDPLDESVKVSNIARTRAFFSRENLLNDLRQII